MIRLASITSWKCASGCAINAVNVAKIRRSTKWKIAALIHAPHVVTMFTLPLARSLKIHAHRFTLQLWFYAIFLFVTTRHGVSGKELQRQLGVTYKTAWRIGHKIRDLISGDDDMSKLVGHVELDEAYVGGRRSGGKRGRGAPGKTVVMGMKEKGGRIRAEVIPNVKKPTLREVTNRNVEKGSTVSTDELMSYGLLTGDGYNHGQVVHGQKIWKYFDYRTGEWHDTNSVESFWKLFKASVRSTHIHVSAKYMDKYLSEFTFRSNHREKQNAMFDLLISWI